MTYIREDLIGQFFKLNMNNGGIYYLYEESPGCSTISTLFCWAPTFDIYKPRGSAEYSLNDLLHKIDTGNFTLLGRSIPQELNGSQVPDKAKEEQDYDIY